MRPLATARLEALCGLLLISGWLRSGQCLFYLEQDAGAGLLQTAQGERLVEVKNSTTTTNFIGFTDSLGTNYAPVANYSPQPDTNTAEPVELSQASETTQQASSSIASTQEPEEVGGQTEVTPPAGQVAAAEAVAASETRLNEVRETELEAIAAVEASIGFGSELFGSSLSAEQCYDEYGNARFCEPPFENIAFERAVKVSSECGSPPARFCTAHNDQVRSCHICNAQNPKKRHPAAYLSDLNNPSEPTCWVSAPVSAAAQQQPTNQSSATTSLDNVSLELNFNKQYEIIYVNLQFCSLKPDSLAIYKSLDYGKSWLPYQFYSSQCARIYGRPQGPSPDRMRPDSTPQASCTNASQSGSPTRIAFSPLEGAGNSVERADWISASDIRISLDKHQPAWIYSHLRREAGANSLTGKMGTIGNFSTKAADDDDDEPLTSPSDTFSYAVADLTVGARCKCNGHASRCVHARDGQLECDCRHNTAGRDCDKCAPFHFDRPWAPATQLDANPCQPCNCNGHSRKCHFDQELYRLSGKRSGGVCMGCRDNTEGRFCHYCKEGFTRDHSKPMTDKEACKHCNCHPIGSLGKVCNQTSGQCPCKEGVVGLQCSRCAAGYQQSRSLTEPCIKLPENENDINYYPPEASVVAHQTEPQAMSESEPPEGSLRGAQSTKQQPSVMFANDVSMNEMDTAPAGVDKDEDLADVMGGLDSIAVRKRPKNNLKLSGRPGRPAQDYDLPNRIRKPAQLDFYPSGVDEPSFVGTNNKDFDYYLTPHRYLRPSWQPMENVYGGRKKSSPNRYVLHSAMSNYGPPVGADDDNSDMITSAEYPALQSYHSRDYNRINHMPTNWVHPRGRDYGGQEEALDSSLEAVCNNCGKKTRRLSQRKFCQADYAIRAKVLIWQVGDDWTRLVVEILDIFKSPLQLMSAPKLVNSNELAAQSGIARFQDNLLKPDDASMLNDTYGELGPLLPAQQQADSSHESKRPHRLLIGSKQSIWIPSEDFQCKCPSLIVGVEYLLMGPVDSQRGVHSLQLDRHGVATRWNTMSHQAKLMRYQRNQERDAYV